MAYHIRATDLRDWLWDDMDDLLAWSIQTKPMRQHPFIYATAKMNHIQSMAIRFRLYDDAFQSRWEHVMETMKAARIAAEQRTNIVD